MSRPKIIFGIVDNRIHLWNYLPQIEVMINNIRWRWSRPPAFRVWVDSGGYQIMKKNLKISLQQVLDRYRRIDADIYMSLDKPPLTLCRADNELIKFNIDSFEYLYSKLEDKKIVPIVHCYPLDLLHKVIDVYSSYGVDMIGYGGAVPPTLGRTGRGSRILPLIALAITIKSFKNHVHVLGIGGSFSMYNVLKPLGVSSIDSSAWRVKAAYGKIIVPGLGERYVGSRSIRFGKKRLTDEEKSLLILYLERSGFPFIENLEDILKTFEGRAFLNAWLMYHYPEEFSHRNRFYWLKRLCEKLSSMSLSELEILYGEAYRKYVELNLGSISLGENLCEAST